MITKEEFIKLSENRIENAFYKGKTFAYILVRDSEYLTKNINFVAKYLNKEDKDKIQILVGFLKDKEKNVLKYITNNIIGFNTVFDIELESFKKSLRKEITISMREIKKEEKKTGLVLKLDKKLNKFELKKTNKYSEDIFDLIYIENYLFPIRRCLIDKYN